MGVRRGTIAAQPRTQDSLVVSADGDSWFLLNASPEIARQLESFPKLHPRRLRDSPLAGILLSNGDLDHCLGLLSLRESHPLRLYCTERVRRGFSEENRLFATLQRFPGQLTWCDLPLLAEQPLVLTDGSASGLSVRAVPMPGGGPLHLKGLGNEPSDNVGFVITEMHSGKTCAYLPAVAALTPAVSALAAEVDVLFIDGTFWSSDELVSLGIGKRRAEDMSHCPIGGAGGSLELLMRLPHVRRIYTHINNTNPILREDSPEHGAVRAAGVEIAHDGMELQL